MEHSLWFLALNSKIFLMAAPFCVVKTTALTKSPYLAWKIGKIWWKVVAARIWWWDEVEWEKSALNVINDVERTQKNALVKNITSTDFLGAISLDSPISGDIHPSRIENLWPIPLRVNTTSEVSQSPFKSKPLQANLPRRFLSKYLKWRRH